MSTLTPTKKNGFNHREYEVLLRHKPKENIKTGPCIEY
jgi:hypothetical protein